MIRACSSVKAKYATEILARFGMEKCNMVCNPIVTGSKLMKDENGKVIDASKYMQMIGCLMYLLATRPDLAYSVCLVARYMERPTEMQLSAIKRILRYLKGTISFGVIYKEEKVRLIGWSDSDYACDTNDRKSTSRYVYMIGNGAISWSSKKQPIVTFSTTEVEYVVAVLCSCQGIWLKRILSHLCEDQKEL
ncbi:secreted RxLR effector protein 161-like [Medicago truncatula]|uniref:secreted RxLR effector protein 161-like n=1 Tax=Medicago truncatula TaxID=3880 RepID=UPI000D2F1835|nr:secreted RxLR effector protein 161-like [Medicago truncatula]